MWTFYDKWEVVGMYSMTNIVGLICFFEAIAALLGSFGNITLFLFVFPCTGESMPLQLEAAHEREKELMQEIAELQWR